MAQTTSYIFTFQGLDAGIVKLTTLQKLIDSIATKSKAINFGGGNINVGGASAKSANNLGTLSTVALNIQLASLASLAKNLEKVNKVMYNLGSMFNSHTVPGAAKILKVMGTYSTLGHENIGTGVFAKDFKKAKRVKTAKVPPKTAKHVSLEDELKSDLGIPLGWEPKLPSGSGSGSGLGGANVAGDPLGLMTIMDSFRRVGRMTKTIFNESKPLLKAALADVGTFGSELWRDIKLPFQALFGGVTKSWGPSKSSSAWNVLKRTFGGGGAHGGSSPFGNTAYAIDPYGPMALRSGFPMPNLGRTFHFPMPNLGRIFHGLGEGFKKISGSISGMLGGHGLSGSGIRHLGRALGVPRELTGVISHLGKLGIAIGVVVIALFALREAFKLLLEGIKEGSEAYKQAAAQGLNVSTSNRINKAFAAIGMSTPNMQGAVSYQLGQGNDTNAILNAARGGQFGEQGQQLLNMSSEFAAAMRDAESNSKQMDLASKDTMEMSIQIASISREWKTLLAQTAANMKEVFGPQLEIVKLLLLAANNLEEFAYKINHPYDSLMGKRENQQYFFGKGASAPAGSLEHLGLVMKGAAPDKHLQDISQNTSKMVSVLDRIAIAIYGKMNLATRFTGVPLHLMPLPQLPS